MFVIRSREVPVQGFGAFWRSAARGKVSAEDERGGGGLWLVQIFGPL